MKVAIKICGITRVQDALEAVSLNVEMLGLNFYPPSPRSIVVAQAQEIARAVAGRARLAGVFVNSTLDEVLAVARAVPLDIVQLHGGELKGECAKIAEEFQVVRALRADASFCADDVAAFRCCQGILLDTPCATHGGSGEAFDWKSVDWPAVRAAHPAARLFLAGGLNPANIAEAIRCVRPDVVDVASGVESAKGIKCARLMREFCAAVRAAESEER